jgi:hypothetical protein
MSKHVGLLAGCPVLAAWLLLAAGGCAGGEKFARIDPVPPGKAAVYVYRPSAFTGGAIVPVIEINGEPVGRLKSGGYIAKLVPVGRTEVYTVTEAPASVILQVEEQKHYFVREHINMGFWIGRPALQEMAERRALKEICNCRLNE